MNFLGKITDSIGCVALVSIFVAMLSCFTHAQSLVTMSVENHFNEMNSLSSNEGTRPIRDFDFMYTMTMNHDSSSASSDSSSSISVPAANNDFALPPSPISEAEIAAMDSAAEAYKWARIVRLASSKTPRSSIEALRSIHGDEKTVQEIAYSSQPYPQTINVKHKNIFIAIASLFAKKQAPTETQTIIANGY